ncbi:dapper homolog 1 isoform X2 [Gouania willdenowi]|uniref:dapper homolog 1 isoform X2 n=1 Tax=Gouania willdenowi TaxID=441366 RepID=UPI0010553CB3|nr:dapper homolog 1 isoform X2 [Gouania willdenowi]
MPELQQRLRAALCGLTELQVRRDRQEVLVRSALSLHSSEEEKQNPVTDVQLVAQLQELQLRLDEQESHDQTDSSGFYELSDGLAGSLSNSSNSLFGDCFCSTNNHDQRLQMTGCSGGGASNAGLTTCNQELLHVSLAPSPAPPHSEDQRPNSNPAFLMMTSQQSVHSYILALLWRRNHPVRTGNRTSISTRERSSPGSASGPRPVSDLKPSGSPQGQTRTSLRVGYYNLGSFPSLNKGGANQKTRFNRSGSTHFKLPCKRAETKTRQSSKHGEVPRKGGGDTSQKRLKKPHPLSKTVSAHTVASKRVTSSRQRRPAFIPEEKAPPTEMLDSVGGGATGNEHRRHCHHHHRKSRTGTKKKTKCLLCRSDDVMGSDSASLFRSTTVETSGDERSTNPDGECEESAQEVRKTPLKAFVKIKASHDLKQKILRFRAGPLRLMTTM